MWRGYRNMYGNRDKHYNVNHSIGFVDFDGAEVHTQNIERFEGS
jgi:hypothetical protein